MDTQQAQLYARIMAFEFDEPGTCRTFSARLAEENRWSEDFADRAVFEYRRFLFLAMAAGHAVCPSEDVDEVWHLHLIYSRSYWQRLCGEVLGRPLHHDPSRGGGAEYGKHRAMYDQTLASYRRLFGEEPPEALWPRGAKRFPPRSDHRRTDINGYWLIRKPAFLAFALWRPIRSSRTALVSMALVPIPLLGIVWGRPFNMRGPDFLVFYACLLLIAFAAAIVTRLIAKAASTRGEEEAPLDAYQMAYLNGGPDWAAKTAVALLLAEQEVIITRTTPLRLGRFGAVRTKGHALERALSASMPAAPEGASWAQICQHSKDAVDDLERSLQERGLTMTRERALVAQWSPLAIMGVAIAIGVIKIFLGLERHRPVGFLAAMCLAALVISLALFVRRVYRTSAGDQKLLSLKVGHQHLRREARQSPFSVQEGMPLAVALFGLGVLVQGPLQHLAYSLDPRTRVVSRAADGLEGHGGGCGGAGGVGAACGAGGGHGCSGGGGGGCGGGGGGCGGGGCGGGGCGGCGS